MCFCYNQWEILKLNEMKKLFFLVLCTFILGSCASHYVVAPKPNLPMTQNNLKANEVNVENLVSAYVSFSGPITFYRNNFAIPREEGVQGGVYIQYDVLSGEQLIQPYTIPVLYYKGSQKGQEVILKNGRREFDFFLGEFISSETAEDKTALRFWVQIGDSGVSFPFLRAPSSGGGVQRLGSTPRDYVFQLERFVASSNEEANHYIAQGYRSDGQYIWLDQKGTRYYLVNDFTGQSWFVTQNEASLTLSATFLQRLVDDQKEILIPNSKRVGQ